MASRKFAVTLHLTLTGTKRDLRERVAGAEIVWDAKSFDLPALVRETIATVLADNFEGNDIPLTFSSEVVEE